MEGVTCSIIYMQCVEQIATHLRSCTLPLRDCYVCRCTRHINSDVCRQIEQIKLQIKLNFVKIKHDVNRENWGHLGKMSTLNSVLTDWKSKVYVRKGDERVTPGNFQAEELGGWSIIWEIKNNSNMKRETTTGMGWETNMGSSSFHSRNVSCSSWACISM